MIAPWHDGETPHEDQDGILHFFMASLSEVCPHVALYQWEKLTAVDVERDALSRRGLDQIFAASQTLSTIGIRDKIRWNARVQLHPLRWTEEVDDYRLDWKWGQDPDGYAPAPGSPHNAGVGWRVDRLCGEVPRGFSINYVSLWSP